MLILLVLLVLDQIQINSKLEKIILLTADLKEGVGCGVLPIFRTFGELSRAGVNYLIFREKVPEFFPPDQCKGWQFLISKKPKDIIQQGF
ncbi:MAG: hypothetical protein EWV50_04245 [Microcystis aeruginosa Ma_MB_F_20061100_S20]|uniref:Uncharacterized protein n=1 Tax=Microcystis aeruginosa Ma_MB_F_20061100_S20D TaxID=2486253 RepID=A0A552EB08_MICAE|nr:MAG: hypothetical protein EWV78_20075 [Microcystis aeruginosa Ma_MB_F_20061100_S20D]TRU42041.1 MAG: hypothetical protein EWV50_04245 [Microcystis aeruginosa Ma_MB_F_20061100_S20]